MSEDNSKNLEDKLKDRSKKITNINEVVEVLHWDQEVMMPEGGIEARKQQLSTLSGLRHELIVSEELETILENINVDELDQKGKSNYREIKRMHDRSKRIDQELIEELSSQSSQTLDKWKKARKEDNFDIVKDELKELIRLKREYANQVNPDKEPYKVLFNDYEPYIEFETMHEIMTSLRDNLTEIFSSIKEGDKDIENVFEKEVSKDKQKELNEEVLDSLGYDRKRGRLDTSEHPFTTGNQFDARITTRFSDEDLSKSLFPTIHEFGHALYEQGLPKEHYGLPSGTSRDLSIHESQSRLWENHVGRSKSFWSYMTPKLTQLKDFSDVSSNELWLSANRVKKENLIRVEADEITYHLHIYLRYEIERKLINGEIEVEELPEVWNEAMNQYLDLTPEQEVEGVLQDIHWYQGSIGYFTTYSLGSVIAAQIYNAAEKDIVELDQKIEQGEFEELREWLKENVHAHGCIYKTEKLVKKATGEELDVKHFLRYIKDKYSEIYDF